ncbi:hypothetical protein ADO06_00639 [Streptococcus parauberis]|nr:hypothetical protein ADO06_00639 [Streptococcus parauberis]
MRWSTSAAVIVGISQKLTPLYSDEKKPGLVAVYIETHE